MLVICDLLRSSKVLALSHCSDKRTKSMSEMLPINADNDDGV